MPTMGPWQKQHFTEADKETVIEFLRDPDPETRALGRWLATAPPDELLRAYRWLDEHGELPGESKAA